MRYKQAIELPKNDFKRLYGVSHETFKEMKKIVLEAKVGKRGSRPKLSIPDRVLLTLQYWREYRTFFHIAQDWGIHESTAWRTVKRIEDVLIKAQEFRLPSKRQLTESEEKIEMIVVDVTETEIERPKKNKKATIAAKRSATP